MTTKTALSPRPSPPNEQISSKVLHPIYQSLDSHNYSKALKLTSSSSPSSDWDIVKALRIHALERTGKKREALLLLWEVLTKGVVLSANIVGISCHGRDHGSKQAEEVWWELHERIQSLTDAADLVGDAAASASCWHAPLLDPVERLDVRGFACLARKGISSSGGSAGSGNVSAAAASAGATSKTSSKGKPSKGGKQQFNSSNGGDSNSRAKCYPPVTDDAVLSTLAVTLRIEGLYATLSEMYFQAIEEAIAPSTGEMSADNLQSVLEEAVCVHFRAVCDCSSVENKSNSNHNHNRNHNDSTSGNGNDNGHANSETSNKSVLSDEQLRCKLPNLKTLLQLTTYYERMQTSSLQLSKLSGESLHFQWTAIASLWYKESLVELVELLETLSSTLAIQGDTDHTDGKQSKLPSNRRHTIQQHVCSMLKIESPSEIQPMMQKLKQKIALLPRLAESLSSRMVKNKQLRQEQRQSSQAVDDAGYGPSESDWDVYLETLLHQNKKEEALEVLKSIPCSSMTSGSGDGGSASDDPHDSGSGSGTGILPQIHDEHTIENHVGSVLPYTQRKKLERLSAIALELGKFEEASEWYRELLEAFPDQWTYWVGLVDSSVLLGTRQWLRCKEKKSVMNGEGWNSCRSFAKEVIASLEERKGARSIRGPYLVLIELAAVKVLAEGGRGVEALREEICSYGDRFGPLASCCFADIRCYISLLVQSTIGADGSNDIPDDVSKLLVWAKNIWMENSQTDADAGNGPVSAEDLRERRKKLRAYIFAVQVVYCVTAELGVGCMTLQLYSPSIPQMTSEWRTSLSFLPGVAPKDGGQKEILPGDEIILLITQYLQFQISCESPRKPNNRKLIAAAALLEQAMDHSPYNPHLKIAAIGVYSQLHAAYRALSIYNELGVKQIQLDSCSYLILPLLIRGGLYTSAIEISSSILRLHGSTSKDVKDYASKSFQNGYLLKAKEMVTFQREKMRPSLQLLYSKGVVMDCAALMKASDLNGGLTSNEPKNNVPAVKLGEVRGLSGGDGDLAKAEKLTTDAEGHFNAPSIIHAAASNATLQDFVFSDNRDMTVNYFEILYKNHRLTENEMTSESLMRGHIHGILVRAVMLSGVAKGPKKGKVPKCSDEMTYRCLSLVDAIERLNRFSMGHGVQMHDMEKQLLQLLCALCQTVAMIVTGTENDSMTEREKTVVSIIESVQPIVASVRDAFKSYADNTINDRSGTIVCQLLPDRIVPVYILIETTATLFDLFGWGKRKRKTKPAAGALAELALSFRDLLSDMMHATLLFRAFGDGSNTTDVESLIKHALDSICDKQREDATSNCEDYAAVRRAINEVSVSRSVTTDRVDPFLVDMWENLGSFENNE